MKRDTTISVGSQAAARFSADRTLLLQFIASLTLADHLGDVAGDIDTVLERIGYQVTKGDGEGQFDDLRAQLARDGITTLYGTRFEGD